MLTFTESLRYEYPLTRGSVVLDLGAFEGSFSKTLSQKYGCHIYAFEPVKAFYDRYLVKIDFLQNVKFYNYGIGGSTRTEQIQESGCASSIFMKSDNMQTIQIKSLKDALIDLNLDQIDLIKVNIEGMEYELLEHMLAENLISKFRDIQVQFHRVIPDCEERRDRIRIGLAKTHELTYDCPFIWENWCRK